MRSLRAPRRRGLCRIPGSQPCEYRKFGGSISTEPRINERIRVPEVRLVGPNGEQVGIVRIEDAMRLARESELDLVEVAPQAKPPWSSSWTTASSSTRTLRRSVRTVVTSRMLSSRR
nr:translation initiation factor IF-3 [Raineyella fluvialis]